MKRDSSIIHARSHCVKGADLFVELHDSYFTKRERGKKSADSKAGEIFAELLRIIILDVIENNTIFVSPKRKNWYSELSLRSLTEGDYNRIEQYYKDNELSMPERLTKYAIDYCIHYSKTSCHHDLVLTPTLKKAIFEQEDQGNLY